MLNGNPTQIRRKPGPHQNPAANKVDTELPTIRHLLMTGR